MLFVLGISFVFAFSSLVVAQDCKDIDPIACKLMAQQRPDLCADDTIAKTACPAYCKKCPVTCYHCNATVKDYHLCNTTMKCAEGEICMKKELKSALDGHHEYEMTCADKVTCDDPWSSLSAFGKRSKDARDVSITCCSDDLCNYPETLTTKPEVFTTAIPTTTRPTTTRPTTKTPTGCVIDLVIVIDESTSVRRYQSEVEQFLHDVVSPLPISDAEVHVSLGMFASSSRHIFDLDDLHSKDSVLRALTHLSLHGGSGDIDVGLKYVTHHALRSRAGDRPSAKNVVLILTDDGTHNRTLLTSLEHEVHKIADVISVEIGPLIHFGHLASDTHHQFHLNSPLSLSQISRQVSELICR
ncbi:uncharacterized protein LOC132731148 isoform X2 [Ruditapes philippinarum]|uniref:uncharacterized protein LOC132731148 isoform X2 n=1 Tax=Ruditapes philippinarum TaxID=129788 RepID=UPI00295AAE20|nr:uncharacterized protein LOC132731148 isoform X2 [Ruditapes philippinarum]